MPRPHRQITHAAGAPRRARAGAGAILVVLAAWLAMARPARADEPAYLLVVHVDVTVRSMTRAELKQIFSGRRTRWPGGQHMQLVLPPKGSGEMRWLCKYVLGLPEEVYRRYLLQKVFRGELRRPLYARSASEALSLVSTTLGAISPARATAVSAGVHSLLPR